MISAVNGRKRVLLTKSALEWHNKRCTAQSTLCVGNKKGKTELKAMCDFFLFYFFFFSIAILGSRYDTRIASPSIAMHRCIVTPLITNHQSHPAHHLIIFRLFHVVVPRRSIEYQYAQITVATSNEPSAELPSLPILREISRFLIK